MDGTVRDLVFRAYVQRDRSLAAGPELFDDLNRARELAADDLVWQARIDLEEARHRRIRNGRDAAVVQLVARAGAVIAATEEPLLTGLAYWLRLVVEPNAVGGDELEGVVAGVEAAVLDGDRWAIPGADVLGYLLLNLADVYGAAGESEAELAVLLRAARHESCAPSERGKAYRRARTVLVAAGRDEEADAILEEFRRSLPELGPVAEAHYWRRLAHESEIANLWRESIARRVRAFELSENQLARGNIANHICYCWWQLSVPDEIDRWSSVAEACWDAYGQALTGRTITARYRAAASMLRGEWRQAAERLAAAFSYTSSNAPQTWAAALEVLAEAAEQGQATGFLDGITFAGRTFSVAASDVDALVTFALGLDEPRRGAVGAGRRAVAATTLFEAGWCRRPDDLELRLIVNRDHARRTARWWRSGQCSMALSSLARVDGDLAAAAAHAADALDVWRRHEVRATGTEHPWLKTRERRRYLSAWRAAVEARDHALAARVAESARGTALAALIGDPSLAGTRLADELRGAAKATADEEAAERGSELRTEEGGEDDVVRRLDPPTRAARAARAAATRASLDPTVRTIYAMIGGTEPQDPFTPATADWTLWVDLDRDHLYVAAASVTGRCVANIAHLTRAEALTLERLGNPETTTALVARANARTEGALSAVGRAVAVGDLGAALRSASADDPIKVHIAPAGGAWAIPWAAVSIDEVPLVDLAVVTIVPSLSTAVELARIDPTPITRPVAVLDTARLDGAKVEEAALRDCWGSAADVLTTDGPSGRESTATYRKGADPSAGLYVASVHGDYGSGGLGQRLRFPDRDVPAYELFEWTFPTATVFGACWVGRADTASSGDALGVCFPVLARGVRTMVAGLFGIHDATTGAVLADTYRLVHKGVPLASALRDAQRAAHESVGRHSPLADWAGLVAIGVH